MKLTELMPPPVGFSWSASPKVHITLQGPNSKKVFVIVIVIIIIIIGAMFISVHYKLSIKRLLKY